MNETSLDFEQIYITYFSAMKRFAKEYVISEEDAENIVQDVFADIWEKRDLLSFHINLIAYLFMSIKNRCIDHLRSKIRNEEVTNDLQEEFQMAARLKYDALEAFDKNLFSEKDIEKVITNAIDNLPEKCREIFIKSKIEGKKHKEIAAELNVSINTIESQMSIAYRKLKQELKNYAPLLLFLILI